jgi:hypothetical protein
LPFRGDEDEKDVYIKSSRNRGRAAANHPAVHFLDCMKDTEEQIMGTKSIFIIHSIGVLVFVIGVFMLGMPLLAKGPAGSSPEGGSDVVLFGIIDPEGHKRIWALPAESATAISRRLAAKYPPKTMEGVSFFQVNSWQDTSDLLVEAQTQQGLLIVDLYNEIKRLKVNAPNTQLAGRVMKLEQRMIEITDSGLPGSPGLR